MFQQKRKYCREKYQRTRQRKLVVKSRKKEVGIREPYILYIGKNINISCSYIYRSCLAVVGNPMWGGGGVGGSRFLRTSTVMNQALTLTLPASLAGRKSARARLPPPPSCVSVCVCVCVLSTSES